MSSINNKDLIRNALNTLFLPVSEPYSCLLDRPPRRRNDAQRIHAKKQGASPPCSANKNIFNMKTNGITLDELMTGDILPVNEILPIEDLNPIKNWPPKEYVASIDEFDFMLFNNVFADYMPDTDLLDDPCHDNVLNTICNDAILPFNYHQEGHITHYAKTPPLTPLLVDTTHLPAQISDSHQDAQQTNPAPVATSTTLSQCDIEVPDTPTKHSAQRAEENAQSLTGNNMAALAGSLLDSHHDSANPFTASEHDVEMLEQLISKLSSPQLERPDVLVQYRTRIQRLLLELWNIESPALYSRPKLDHRLRSRSFYYNQKTVKLSFITGHHSITFKGKELAYYNSALDGKYLLYHVHSSSQPGDEAAGDQHPLLLAWASPKKTDIQAVTLYYGFQNLIQGQALTLVGYPSKPATSEIASQLIQQIPSKMLLSPIHFNLHAPFLVEDGDGLIRNLTL